MTLTHVTWRREASIAGASRSACPGWLARRRQGRVDRDRAGLLVRRFLNGAAGAHLSRDTQSCAGLVGLVSPQVVHVVLGEKTDRLIVRMLPGQLVTDYQERSAKLAEALGVHALRITRRSPNHITLELLRVDPLAAVVPATHTGPDLVLGRLDTGATFSVELGSIAHTIVQGQTRSGKSRFTYGLLAQLAHRPDVLICGSDVTGLLLRPFRGGRHEQLQATGSRDVREHLAVLEHLAKIMDDRIESIPEDSDVFPCTAADPWLFVVIEELPGLLRLAKQQGGKDKLADQIQAAFGRLLAEGAKAGIRLLLITQRADATIIGGFERGQAPLRISFAVEGKDAIRMLHPACPDEVALAHVSALPGRALLSAPGIPYARLRSPEMGDYVAFRDRIRPSDDDGTAGVLAVV
jgi:hypothetical protein